LCVSVLLGYVELGLGAHSIPTHAAKAIDRYIHLRADAQPNGTPEIDPRLSAIIETIFNRCIADGEYKQVCASTVHFRDFLTTDLFGFAKAIGIALESRRLDIVKRIYEQMKDVSVLSYAMEAVIDTQFSLSYRDRVLQFLYPLFPPPENRSPHIHALTRLLVALSSSATTVPLLVSLVPSEKLLAYQFAFDLVEGGPQDFLEAIRNELPEGSDEVRSHPVM
jgi:26S proteasome regulatory subunit N2